MRNLAVVIISCCLFVSGCQSQKILTDADKQVQIDTMYRRYARQFPQVNEITARELQKLQRQGKKLVLVDVRSPAEIAVSYIPGAITPDEFERNPAQYQNAIAIAYCTIGYRSGIYAQKMQQQGQEVINLAGGLLAWSHTNGELTDNIQETNRVHVFGRQWKLTSEAYEAVW